ncbi:MAG TPA: MMPL family transporter [Actinomycetota bacterium]|jgi:RND superfamily putative drug exporter|nr:MMPL family transporter [Actinomycetota bacterium]
MKLSTESLARSGGRHPWRTLVVWVVALLAAVVLSSLFLGGALTTDTDFTNDPEAKRAAGLLEERLRGTGEDIEFVVVTAERAVTKPEYRAYVEDLQATIAALGPDVVQRVGSYLTNEGPVSDTGRSTLLPVTLAGVDHTSVGEHAELLVDTVKSVEASEGFEALVAGPSTLENDFIRLAEEGLQQGESVGLAVALVVLVFVFGAVVAGLIPIILAVMAIAIALGAAAVFGLVFDLPFFIANIITMIGLAVGIDYSLFTVSRYREERAKGLDKLDAITHAGATASRAVFFSGLTVMVALTGMLLLPNTIYRSIGLGAILVVIIAVAASLTLLPAVLALMGDKINALRIRGNRSGAQQRKGRFWDRVTGTVMRRPVVSLLVATGILVLAALPYFSINEGFSGVSTLPDEAESKQAFLILEREFSGGLGSPVEIVIDGGITPSVTASIEHMQAALAADPSFGPSTVEVNEAGDLALISVPLSGDIAGNDALDAIRELRAALVHQVFDDVPVEVLVGGDTAYNLDYLDQTTLYTPIVFLLVLGLSFVLLTVAFRSLVIPAKAIAMNLLSVGAAFGLLVLFFQRGVGPEIFKDIAGWLGFGQVEAIEAGLPLFIFAILFGLSMDYHVFLLSRIRERFDHTGDNTESVAYGLRTTGALITGAAAIMVAVFAGFAAGPLVGLQQMGFGLAVAVALDATIVRTVLVPATMKLLGNRNWYLPSWLEWLPEVHIEGVATPEGVAEPELQLIPTG